MNVEAMPEERVVLGSEFTGIRREFGRFWLVVEDGTVDMCLKHPGHEEDLMIRADLRRFVEAWRGFRDLRAEIAAGHIRVEGRRDWRDALPDWLLLSGLAPYERQRPGPERALLARARRAAAAE